MISILTIAYNEKVFLPHFIWHYRTLFPGCKILVFSNESDDGTDQIAIDAGCEVRIFKTNGKLCDRTYLEIKNKVWKEFSTDWVLVCDVDELLQITQKQLEEEDQAGTTIIRSEGYNMTSDDDEKLYDPVWIKKGVRSESYDKLYLFNKKYIQEINYLTGCHKAAPKGKIRYSKYAYQLRHYKYYNLPYMIERHAKFAKRLSEENIKRTWGSHYLYSADEITKEFNDARRKAITI